jgi:hypothetical protein
MSDFPEFDHAYKTVLVKDPTDRFEQLAAEANFNVYHSDIWRGTGRKFAELIVADCMERIRVVIAEEAMPVYSDYFLYDFKGHFGIQETKREKFDRAIEEAFKDGADLSGKETP